MKEKMYETPEMEILKVPVENIVRTSITQDVAPADNEISPDDIFDIYEL